MFVISKVFEFDKRRLRIQITAMAEERDYYQILGVTKTADQDAIKKAYRKLALQFHPDKNPDNKEAESKFKEAAQAYEVLGNPQKRTQYDQFGHAAFTRNGRGGGFGGGFTDVNDIFEAFGDIFSDFFGETRSGRSRNQRGSDLRYLLELDLKQVLTGIEKDIRFETEDGCETCEGSGADPKFGTETCAMCGGRGKVIQSQGFFQMASACPACRGRGQKIKKPCADCRGNGRVVNEKKIKVKVPAGVDTGVRLRVAGEGEGGYNGGGPGDLYVEIRVHDHPKFQRQSKDLFGTLKINYIQALLGSEVEVDTLTGKSKVEVPAGTQTGEQIKLEGEGVPSLKSSARGDIYFEVEVEIPKKLKKDEEEMLREIAKLRGDKVKGKKGIFS